MFVVFNIMYLTSSLHPLLFLQISANCSNKALSLLASKLSLLLWRSFFTNSIQVNLCLPTICFTFLHDSNRAIRAGVSTSSLIKWPSHDSLLLLMIKLQFSTFVILYNSILVITFGHLTFRTFRNIRL